jgi:hypothetical protein
MNYVMHFCRNSRLSERSKNYCNNGWIDKDLTNVSTNPPSWKYCRSCAEKLGIDFEKQKPDDYRTKDEKEKIKIKYQKSVQTRLNKN